MLSWTREACTAAVLIAGATAEAQTRDVSMPVLRKQGTATQLIVEGQPFLIIGGLNGDQTHQGRNLIFGSGEFEIQRVRLYRYR